MCKKTMTDSLNKEIQRFRDWAASYPMESRSGEWECDYEHWKELNSSFDDYLALNKPNEATSDEISDLIYAVARDNEMEELIDSVSENPEWFRRLLTEVLRTNEHDAKWQFAVALGKGIRSIQRSRATFAQNGRGQE